MKAMRILTALEGVDGGYIEEAYSYKADTKRTKQTKWSMHTKRSKGGIKLVFGCAAAAAAAVILIAVTAAGAGLPTLTIGDSVGGMGFEGYLVEEIGELGTVLSHTEPEPVYDRLPVYRNPIVYDENMTAVGVSYESMRLRIEELAGRMGLDVDGLEITDNSPSEEYIAEVTEKMNGEVPEGYFDPTELRVSASGMTIAVDIFLTATIEFDSPAAIPVLSRSDSLSDYNCAVMAAEYLKESYPEWTGSDSPEAYISGGDRRFDGTKTGYSISLYDGGGSAAQSLVNREMRQTVVYFDDANRIYMLRMYEIDTSEKVGDYPIISEKSAVELLESGSYLTSAPSEYDPSVGFEWVDLTYRSGRYDQYYIPYYRFYSQIDEYDGGSGMKTYAAYYVPAVSEEYISNMPSYGRVPYDGGVPSAVPHWGEK